MDSRQFDLHERVASDVGNHAAGEADEDENCAIEFGRRRVVRLIEDDEAHCAQQEHEG